MEEAKTNGQKKEQWSPKHYTKNKRLRTRAPLLTVRCSFCFTGVTWHVTHANNLMKHEHQLLYVKLIAPTIIIRYCFPFYIIRSYNLDLQMYYIIDGNRRYIGFRGTPYAFLLYFWHNNTNLGKVLNGRIRKLCFHLNSVG